MKVIASDGDLELGGLDWTAVLVDVAAERFFSEFKEDPRNDPGSHQALMLEAEQAKRSLSVRPRAAITVQHAGHRQTYQIEQKEFERLSRKLLKRSAAITRRILANNNLGWAHIDSLLTTGGASRMPMIKEILQKLSGRTLNSTLSPDQSIAHGAAYYAGMLLSNSKYARTVFSSQTSARLSKIRQQSVNARSLGIMIRYVESGERIPHYIIPANAALPVSKTHVFGTVVANQTSVHVRIVESGAGPDKPPTEIGECHITNLPTGLPKDSLVEVNISYDTEARVHVTARELKNNLSAEVDFIRQENLSGQLQNSSNKSVQKAPKPKAVEPKRQAQPPNEPPPVAPDPVSEAPSITAEQPQIESSEEIVLRCPACKNPLNHNGECDSETCFTDSQAIRKWVASTSEVEFPSSNSAEEEF